VAAAAEQVAAYAPDLDVRGAYVGSAPVDLTDAFAYADGTSLTGAAGYLLTSLAATYPVTAAPIDRILDDAGRSMMHATADQCTLETALDYGFHHSAEYTADHRPLPGDLAADPVLGPIIADQRLGEPAPAAPVFVVTGNADEVQPADIRRLAGQWCAAGTPVTLMDIPLPKILPGWLIGHSADAAAGEFGGGLQWLTDRFAGRPVSSNCSPRH
jgi:hypothetical protein